MKSALLFLVLASCAPPPSYITYHGLRVRAGETGETREAVESATEHTMDHAIRRDGYSVADVIDAVWGTPVWVDTEPFDCPWTYGSPEKCSGVSTDRGIRYVFKDCIAASAFIHELLHHIQTHVTGYRDYEHIATGMWGAENTTEGNARWDTCVEMCTALCMGWLMSGDREYVYVDEKEETVKYALAAMAGILASGTVMSPGTVAREAFAMADAMMSMESARGPRLKKGGNI